MMKMRLLQRMMLMMVMLRVIAIWEWRSRDDCVLRHGRKGRH